MFRINNIFYINTIILCLVIALLCVFYCPEKLKALAKESNFDLSDPVVKVLFVQKEYKFIQKPYDTPIKLEFVSKNELQNPDTPEELLNAKNSAFQSKDFDWWISLLDEKKLNKVRKLIFRSEDYSKENISYKELSINKVREWFYKRDRFPDHIKSTLVNRLENKEYVYIIDKLHDTKKNKVFLENLLTGLSVLTQKNGKWVITDIEDNVIEEVLSKNKKLINTPIFPNTFIHKVKDNVIIRTEKED